MHVHLCLRGLGLVHPVKREAGLLDALAALPRELHCARWQALQAGAGASLPRVEGSNAQHHSRASGVAGLLLGHDLFEYC